MSQSPDQLIQVRTLMQFPKTKETYCFPLNLVVLEKWNSQPQGQMTVKEMLPMQNDNSASPLMPMNGCLKCCVEKGLETATLKGQNSAWLVVPFKGTGMEISTTGIPYQFLLKVLS